MFDFPLLSGARGYASEAGPGKGVGDLAPSFYLSERNHQREKNATSRPPVERIRVPLLFKGIVDYLAAGT